MNTSNETQGAGSNSALPVRSVEALFEKETISMDDLKSLTKDERAVFNRRLTELANTLKGKELDYYHNQISELISDDTKNDIWELNHIKIVRAMRKYMSEYNRMPAKHEIAEATGLSRITIYKHLKEYRSHNLFTERKEQFKLMEEDLLAGLYKKALEGDTAAARLYCEMAGLVNTVPAKHVIANQHNYIQVNNIKISQEEVQKLSPEKRKQIETIIKRG